MLQTTLLPSTSTTTSIFFPLDDDSNQPSHHRNNYLPTPLPLPDNTIPHGDEDSNNEVIETHRFSVVGVWKTSEWGPVSMNLRFYT